MNEKQLITNYTLSNGKVFSDKMFYDLLMWKSFEEDYGIDKIGIKAFRDELFAHGVYTKQESEKL